MSKVLVETHVLYEYKFPDGYKYFGYTGEEEFRKKNHIRGLIRGDHQNKQVQEHYNKTKQLPKWKELKRGDEYTIRCGEYYKIDEMWGNPKLLNIKKPWEPKYIKILLEEGFKQAFKVVNNKNIKEFNQTKLGKISISIYNARQNIKKFTKLKRWDDVERWEKLKEERTRIREYYKIKRKINKL